MSRGVVPDVLLQLGAELVLVDAANGLDPVVAQGSQDLDNGLLVGAGPADGVPQLLGVKVRQRGHKGHYGLLQVAAQLRFELVEEILAVHGFELVGYGETLDHTPVSQDVDYGGLVGAEALHGRPQGLGVGLGLEGIGRVYRRGALLFKLREKKKITN